MIDPRSVTGWSYLIAREDVRSANPGQDCGREKPLPECGVLARCCRPRVTPRRYLFRESLSAVTRRPA